MINIVIVKDKWVVKWYCNIVKNLQPYFMSENYRPDVWIAIEIDGQYYPLVNCHWETLI